MDCLFTRENSNYTRLIDMYSDDTEECLKVINAILSMWDLENGRNEMRQPVNSEP